MIECADALWSNPVPRFDPLRSRGRWTASAPKRRYPGAVDGYHINLRVPSDAAKGDERLSFARRCSAIRKPSRIGPAKSYFRSLIRSHSVRMGNRADVVSGPPAPVC